MTLLSYISIPYTSQSNETNYIRFDLMTNKVFVKDAEVLNLEECKDEMGEIMCDEHECVDCCDHESDDCCIYDHKNELIELIKNELVNEEKKGENEAYIVELRETLAKMQM